VVFRIGNRYLGLIARGGYNTEAHDRGAGTVCCTYMNHCIMLNRPFHGVYGAYIHHDNIVWQYNVLLTRATSDAFDAL
jgi:hypothetical protein